jgi:hypothetical protein
MSLARALLKRQSAETKTGGFDILTLLKKQLTQGRLPFTKRKAASLAKQFIEALEEGDRGEYLRLFMELSDVMYAPEAAKNREGKIHPSSLADDCERRMYYELNNVPTTNEKWSPDARLQMIFDVGTWYHNYIQTALMKAGVAEAVEVRVLNQLLRIDGRADFVTKEYAGHKYLGEIKTINSNGYRNIVAKNKPMDKHLNQATIYAKILGITRIVFMYVNKDTSEIHVIYEQVSEKEWEISNRKILGVVKAKKAPERVCSNRRVERALGCEYCNHCFKED